VKKILEFRLWIIGLVGCVVFVSFMAHQQHRATEKYKNHRAEYCSALTTTTEQKEACIEERTSTRDYLPWGYELFSWPEGITTWAIILTGFAIAWQSNETRKAANASEHAAKISERALIAQFRPRVIVRSMRLDPSSYIYYDRRNDGEWRILMQLANTGGTKATVVRGIGYFQEYRDGSPREDLSKGWNLDSPIVIQPGERETIEYALDAAKFRTYMNTLEASTELKGKQPPRQPIFHGEFSYLDENGVQRQTGFGRHWDVIEERFVPLDDPNFEYQD